MNAQALRLEIADFKDADHWRWVLKDAIGAFLGDHAVALDPRDPKYGALLDLSGYLRYYAAPDKRDADERRLLQEVGAWIGANVLGSGICEKILAHGFPPAIVRAIVPPTAAERLLVMPLEMAHARGKPLALQEVSLVFEISGALPPVAAPIGDRLRLLALFSLPSAGNPLNLRRERQRLRKLVHRLAGAADLAVDLHTLQYGVTRGRLRDVLQDGEGWDVIHFSGHGTPGSLVLETPDGRPDLIPAAEVAELLRQTGRRLKLVVLSACHSAAASIEQILAWLGETGPAPATPARARPEPAPTVARALISTLDCAVLAMRYPVEDEFAIALSDALYDGLFRQQQPFPRAVQLALTAALGTGGVIAGALSAATPALFGARAVDLRLMPPKRAAHGFSVPETGLAYFPQQPEHFVGRVTEMTRASAALAPEGEKSGILFYGMAGAGKTSCAVELAHYYPAVDRFQAFVWYRAPDPDKDTALALRDFALAMEKQLPDFTMLHVIDQEDRLRAWLPRLTKMLEDRAVLVVLDNLESLLTESGEWHDESWGLLIDALLKPGGLSRAVLTSRIRPARLPAPVEVLPVSALHLDEALLLVRELPNLRKLLDGAVPGTSLQAGRELLHRTLRLVQGHPKLIEFADNLAADPLRLAAQLGRADAAAGSGRLDAFFRDGISHFDAIQFTTLLFDWTTGIAKALPEVARTFFQFLCLLEEGDRESWIIEKTWANVLRRLARPQPAPAIAEVLTPLLAAGLVEKKISDKGTAGFELLIHPGVAETGRAQAGPMFQEAVDLELPEVWWTIMLQALNRKVPDAAEWAARAGLAAFPYLRRRQEWSQAAAMLQHVVNNHATPEALAAVLPQMRSIVKAAAGMEEEPNYRGILARALALAGQHQDAEAQMRRVLQQASDQEKYGLAVTAAGDLANSLCQRGQFNDALGVVEQIADLRRRAGSGPWSQIDVEVRRLQILGLRGNPEDVKGVLGRVMELREKVKALPDRPSSNDPIIIWSMRETLLDTGVAAGRHLGEWQQALDLIAEIVQSKQLRGAPSFEIAKARINGSQALMQLHRYGEARELLLSCRRVFEKENSIEGMLLAQSGLATLENALGRTAEARRMEETALRFRYIVRNAEWIANGHDNLANYIIADKGEWIDALAHRLAAVLILAMRGSGRKARFLSGLSRNLRQAGRMTLPSDFAALCATLEKVEGVRFRELVEQLVTGRVTGDELLQEILAELVQYGISSQPGSDPASQSGDPSQQESV